MAKKVELDITQIEHFLYDMKGCVKCKGCLWVDHIYMPGIRFSTKCPSATRYHYDSFGPYGKMRIGLGYLEKRLPPSDTLLKLFYACSLCGACDVGCKRNLDLEIELTLEAMRVQLVKDGLGPMPAHREIADAVGREHNVFGYPHEKRGDWIPETLRPNREAKVLYFAGCYSSYLQTEIAKATVRILEASGTPFQMLEDERCCGNLLFSVGMIEKARRQAEYNLNGVKKSGSSILLVSCAECYRMWKVDYPKIFSLSTSDLGFEVKHLSEFVYEALVAGRMTFTVPFKKRLAYHDSCSLSRLSEPWTAWSGERKRYGLLEPPLIRRRGTFGVYQPPREILNQIPELQWSEFIRNRENGFCCGAGRGTSEAFPEFSLWSAGQRLEEAFDLDVEGLISTCPRCKKNFLDATREKGIAFQVLDLSEIIAKAIGA